MVKNRRGGNNPYTFKYIEPPVEYIEPPKARRPFELIVKENAAAEAKAAADAKAAKAEAAAEAKAAAEAMDAAEDAPPHDAEAKAAAAAKGASDVAIQFKNTISSILTDEKLKNYTTMVDKLIDLNNLRVNQLLSGLISTVGDIPQTCRSIKKYYLEHFPHDEDVLIQWSDYTESIEPIVKEYFKEKDGTLQFQKGCLFGNTFKEMCSKNVLGKIKDFVLKIKKALKLSHIPDSFKLSAINSRVDSGSIRGLSNALTNEHQGDKDFEALIKMCFVEKPTPQEVQQPPEVQQQVLDAQEARKENDVENFELERRERPKRLNPVTVGGRRSRYRRRPTKKYFKSRCHSSPKRKRHMKTKRHMRRHRKTKRHTKRY